MYALSEEQYQLEAEPILRKIFVNDNPFCQPFSDNMPSRIIVYPCAGDITEAMPVEAFVAAALKNGDIGCYISLCNGSATYDRPNHCYVPLTDFVEAYAGPCESKLIGIQLPGMNAYGLNSIIYSASGKWGMMLSDEKFGLLGGEPEFIEDIRAAFPDLDRQVYGFLGRLRFLLKGTEIVPPDVTRNKWLRPLLIHVYGEEKANQILLEEKEKSQKPDE